ncbi:hypothetical protein GJV85_07790 [Sulfurimonas aquatica]|uniref:Uncharacterized protein n=1 Tax=Sulfurimonas aquatica TaxID=2672570 RepID=A0A975B0R0_9BACT|nr:hypothetical protein [Sulfurimonas aquatica]QSZ42013.1 hypothetical protein GJV85_07790 [Sulfurimonas aquatica]
MKNNNIVKTLGEFSASKVCKWCGRTFANPFGHQHGSYCSAKCKSDAGK